MNSTITLHIVQEQLLAQLSRCYVSDIVYEIWMQCDRILQC